MGATAITAILSHQKSDIATQIVRKNTILSFTVVIGKTLSLEFRVFFFYCYPSLPSTIIDMPFVFCFSVEK